MITNQKIKLLSAATVCGILIGSVQPSLATNAYKVEGERVMDYINSQFYNSGTGRYVSSINTVTLAKASGSCDLWPLDVTLEALDFASSLDSATYNNRLVNSISALSWYVNGAGYGYTHGGQKFFDDNALLSQVVMRAWGTEAKNATSLNNANFALDFCFSNKDQYWGLPQVPADLGKNIWYVGPGTSQGTSFAMHAKATGNTADLNKAVNFWNIINDPVMNIKTAGNLIRGHVHLENGVWVATEGPVEGATGHMVALGALLYNTTGTTSYKTTALAIADAMMNQWYIPGGGLTGGKSEIIIALCYAYGISGDVKYKNAAKNVLDYLLAHGKDNGGYYPGDGEEWTTDHHGQAPETTMELKSQAHVAMAFLCYAFVDINGHMPLIH